MILLVLGTFIAAGCYGWTRKSRWMVILFGCVPGALLTYYVLGIGVAMVMREGHFYSVPFGGFSVGSNDLVLGTSIVFWLLVWVGVLLVTRGFSEVTK